METTVLDAPFFSKKLEVLDADSSFRGSSGVYRIKRVKLVKK
jgi:diphthamide synthase (EF-2-diphthine--ammonia ligase)